MNWIGVGILTAQVIAAIAFGFISYFTIYRHRVIYNMKRYTLHPPSFEPHRPISVIEGELVEMNKELKSGKYAIQHMIALSEYDIDVYLVQIKR